MEDDSFEHPVHDNLDDHDSDVDDHGSTRAGSKDALLPVTLRQVLAATPLNSNATTLWNIGGRQVKKILIVATVIEEHHRPETHRAWYKLIDGTSSRSVTAFRYIEDTPEPVLPSPPFEGVVLVPEHRYVCILGGLSAMRDGGNVIRVEGFHIVEDCHEIYTHRLQVMAATLALQKGRPPPAVLQNLSDAVKYPSVQEPPELVDKPASAQGPASRSQPLRNPPATSAHSARPAPDPPHGAGASAFQNTTHEFGSSRPSPQPSPEPSPPPRVDKGKQREGAPRRFSMEDPLSDLTPEQRTILLKIMESTNDDAGAGVDVGQLAASLKMEDGIEDVGIITDALDILLEKGHISTDSEALVYKVTSKETTNIYPMDIDW